MMTRSTLVTSLQRAQLFPRQIVVVSRQHRVQDQLPHTSAACTQMCTSRGVPPVYSSTGEPQGCLLLGKAHLHCR